MRAVYLDVLDWHPRGLLISGACHLIAAALAVSCAIAPSPGRLPTDPEALVLNVNNPSPDSVDIRVSARGDFLYVGTLAPEEGGSFVVPGRELKDVEVLIVVAVSRRTGLVLSASDPLRRNIGRPTTISGSTVTHEPADAKDPAVRS